MKLFKRENYLKKIRGFYDDDDIIKVITGTRRCGKSCLMETIQDELKQQGVPSENIIYLNLDKRGYRSIKSPDQLDAAIDAYSDVQGFKYLFIDEIQNVTGFEEVINGFRTDGGWSIFITGSNSYLLSGELVTKLTGRYLEFEMFTLAFDEYLQMKKFYKKPVDSNMNVEMDKYILEGGFPQAVLIDDANDKCKYSKGVAQEIFEKDIKRRLKICNCETFKIVQDYVINNFGATTSISNLHSALLKNGINVKRQTVARYIQVLVDAKIIFECNRFDLKSKRFLSREKKYYLADLSFYYSRNTDNRINYGPTLENIVYTYARAHDYDVSVGKIGKLECDFIMRKESFEYAYVQVARTIALSRENEDREYRPLETIKDNYPKYVATLDTLLQKRNGIININVAEFMSDGKLF